MKSALSTEVKVHSQVPFLSSPDPVESGESLQDFMAELIKVKDAPQEADESDADYALRKEADRHAVTLAASSNLMGGVRYLIIRVLRHMMESGLIMNATAAQDSQVRTVDGAFNQVLEATGLISNLGKSQRSSLLGYFKYVIPALAQHGYELSDELVTMFVDESGDLSVPDVAKEAKRFIMGKGGPITEEEAAAIYEGITSGKTSVMNNSLRQDPQAKIEFRVQVVDGGYRILDVIPELEWRILEGRISKIADVKYY